MKICSVFSLESPHRGDSNEYTHFTIFNMKIKSPLIILNLQLWNFFSKGLKNDFETAVVIEPSVFEPLKIYCMLVNCLYFMSSRVMIAYYGYLLFFSKFYDGLRAQRTRAISLQSIHIRDMGIGPTHVFTIKLCTLIKLIFIVFLNHLL